MLEIDVNSYSKNFNVTFSMLYHYLKEINSKKLIIYKDNCPRPNKNNYAFMVFII